MALIIDDNNESNNNTKINKNNKYCAICSRQCTAVVLIIRLNGRHFDDLYIYFIGLIIYVSICVLFTYIIYESMCSLWCI